MTNLRLPGQYDERLLGPLGLQGPYYDWNRWYLPGVGRYLEPDPIALAGGFNSDFGVDWYNYASGNPLSVIDPEGLDSIRICLKQGTLTLKEDDGDVRMKTDAWPGCGDNTKPGKYRAGKWQWDKKNPKYPNTRRPYSDPWGRWISGYGPWFLENQSP